VAFESAEDVANAIAKDASASGGIKVEAPSGGGGGGGGGGGRRRRSRRPRGPMAE
jgi:hypothetical protein